MLGLILKEGNNQVIKYQKILNLDNLMPAIIFEAIKKDDYYEYQFSEINAIEWENLVNIQIQVYDSKQKLIQTTLIEKSALKNTTELSGKILGSEGINSDDNSFQILWNYDFNGQKVILDQNYIVNNSEFDLIKPKVNNTLTIVLISVILFIIILLVIIFILLVIWSRKKRKNKAQTAMALYEELQERNIQIHEFDESW